MVLDALISNRGYPTVFLGSPEAEAEATACVFHAIADTHFTGSRTAFHGKADTVSR